MSETVQVLRNAYAAMADLWCSPRDIDMAEVRDEAAQAITGLESIDEHSAASLSQFLQDPISEEEYVELFELNPKCSLYLGSHIYQEPKTCAQAGVSDRNKYMLELQGIYKHLGLTPNGKELPDYLPLVVELLALTSGSEDPMREKLIKEYILPVLPHIRSKLEELQKPHLYLLDTLERTLKLDLEVKTKGESHG